MVSCMFILFPFWFSGVTGSLMSKEPQIEWKQQYWRLLMEKCRLAHITLAEQVHKCGPSNAEKTLSHLRTAAVLWAHLDPPGLPVPGLPQPTVFQNLNSLQSNILGLAGDVYFSMVQHWNKVVSPPQSVETTLVDEQLRQILDDSESCNVSEADYFPYPASLHEALQFSLEHYRLALSSVGPGSGGASEVLSLAKRLGNVCNEMGVFFMSKASGMWIIT